jgi:hypothetical protein
MKQPARGRVEKPDEAVNTVWQTRLAPPTGYENALGDALEQVFASGAETLSQVIEGLNKLGSRAPDGASWTEASFQQEMQRLGQ